MATVADVLKRVERIKKDLEYVRSLQVKWASQKKRFPKIYEGMLAQEKAFTQWIDDLKEVEIADAGLLDEITGPTEVQIVNRGEKSELDEFDELDEIINDPNEIELEEDIEEKELAGATA